MTLTVSTSGGSRALHTIFADHLAALKIEPRVAFATPASRAELTRVHRHAYVDGLLDGYSDEWVGRRPDLAAEAAATARAAIHGASLIWRDQARRVFVPAGGNVHAGDDSSRLGSTVNDVALAADFFSRRGLRAGILDLNGIYAPELVDLTAADPNLSLVSIHDESHDPTGGFRSLPDLGVYGIPLLADGDDPDDPDSFPDLNTLVAWALGLLTTATCEPDVLLYVTGPAILHTCEQTDTVYDLGDLYNASLEVARYADENLASRVLAFGSPNEFDLTTTPLAWSTVAHALSLPHDQLTRNSPAAPPFSW